MERYMEPRLYPEAFGARIFKISRDAKGERLTWMKITGGSLKVKTLLTGEGEEPWKEKADQLRIYSGGRLSAGSGGACRMYLARSAA